MNLCDLRKCILYVPIKMKVTPVFHPNTIAFFPWIHLLFMLVFSVFYLNVPFSICFQAHVEHFTHQKNNLCVCMCSEANFPLFFFYVTSLTLHQVSCVINNFQQTQLAGHTLPPPQRPEPPIGIPMLSLPRVESPLEKLSGLQVRGGIQTYRRTN